MELKHLTSKVTYKIEPNPSGGFIARSTDPSIAPIEAPTWVEMQKKLQTQIMGSIATQFPALNLPMLGNFAGSDGGKTTSRTMISNTRDGEAAISREATPEETTQFAEQFASIMQKNFPELAREISARVESSVPSQTGLQNHGAYTQTRPPLNSSPSTDRDASQTTPENRPIVPETNSAWKFVGICAVILAIALACFLYTHR